MKPQDILFFIIIASLLLLKRNPKYFISLGLVCLLLSMPFFERWIFFTAQRLVWYGAAFLVIAIFLYWRRTSIKNE